MLIRIVNKKTGAQFDANTDLDAHRKLIDQACLSDAGGGHTMQQTAKAMELGQRVNLSMLVGDKIDGSKLTFERLPDPVPQS